MREENSSRRACSLSNKACFEQALVQSAPPANDSNLRQLGWKPAFEQQLTTGDAGALVARVGAHLGSHLLCMTETGTTLLPTSLTAACGELAVGDWLLLEQDSLRGIRRLERNSLIARKAAGERVKTQLIAANIDTLFIVSSCNQELSLSRLERYLALAFAAEVHPIVVLTKADLCDSPDQLRQQVTSLKRDLLVETMDARDPAQVGVLTNWCREGQTVALVGSSGVGKSTLAMSLGAPALAVQDIRQDDAKGRHTTTARWIHRLHAGGLLVDTPGMRELQLAECESGLTEVFDDVFVLAEQCRFRDCSHQSEPDCAVQAAIQSGELPARRLNSFLKLQAEQARNAKLLHELHQESRKQGQFFKSVMSAKRKRMRGE
ncbi:MAG: ribosome small subunit-dependent GTPase A [Planctomycetales bacterium]|nr:ribosome small subunit-dependent GTPase A [Planctomycetales bacterium]